MPTDPALIVAVRQLVTALQRAKSAGVQLAPQDQDAFIRAETNGKYTLKDAQSYLATIDTGIGARNLGRSFAQGALFNFGDEILGKLPKFLGGGKSAEEEMRLRQQLFQQAHPLADAAAGIGGAVASGLLVPEGALVGEGETLGSAVARGAEVGGLFGAASGAGEGEGLKDRAERAAVGGVGGAVLGGAIPAATGGVRVVFNPEMRAGRRLLHAVDASGGIDAVKAAAADATRAGRGGVTMLGDLSDRLRQEADFAANNSDDVLAKLFPAVRDRQADASDRILQDVKANVGDPVLEQRQAELEASRRAFAAGPKGYGGLRDAYPQLDNGVIPIDGQSVAMTPAAQPLADILNQPKVRDALREAQQTGLIGQLPDNGVPSFQKLQDVKERLDDAVTAAYRQGKGNLAHRLGEARDALVAEMQARVPGYADVAREYARRMSLERALQAGAEAWNQVDTRGLQQTVSSLSPEELAEFRRGMASQLITKLRSAKTNRDVAKELVDAAPSMQDKLRIVFGSQEVFDEFMHRVGLEANLAKMRGAVGGSQTARRLAAQGFDPAELGLEAAHGLAYGAHGVASSTSRVLARLGRGALARRTAATMGPWLMTTGPDAIEKLLMSIQGSAAPVSPWAQRAIPAAAGGLFGRF